MRHKICQAACSPSIAKLQQQVSVKTGLRGLVVIAQSTAPRLGGRVLKVRATGRSWSNLDLASERCFRNNKSNRKIVATCFRKALLSAFPVDLGKIFLSSRAWSGSERPLLNEVAHMDSAADEQLKQTEDWAFTCNEVICPFTCLISWS